MSATDVYRTDTTLDEANGTLEPSLAIKQVKRVAGLASVAL